MSRKPNIRKQRSGTAAVEFAMVMPVFVIVIVGAIELCNMNVAKSIVINESREAVRQAINTNADGASIISAISLRVAEMLRAQTADITVSLVAKAPDGTARSSFSKAIKGDLIEAHVSVPYSKIALFSSSFMSSITVRDSCVMQKE